MDKKTVNILKGFALIGVITIHANYPFSPNETLKIIIDQIMRFSVPLFIFLSGYGLAKKYQKTKLIVKDFYWSRIKKILPWYLLISTFYYFSWPHNDSFLMALLKGTADYHLYFVPMIIQLYLLFPVALIFIKRWPNIIFVGTVILQILWFKFVGQNFWTDLQQYTWGFSWIAYFVAGIYLSDKNWNKKILSLGIMIIGLIWQLGDTFILLQTSDQIWKAIEFTRLPVMVFSLGVIFSVFVFRRFFNRFSFIVFMGQQSYIIYLVHTEILRIVTKLFN